MPIVAMPFGKTNLLIRRLFVKAGAGTTVCCSGPGFFDVVVGNLSSRLHPGIGHREKDVRFVIHL